MTKDHVLVDQKIDISTHTPLAGRDGAMVIPEEQEDFYSHAPRGT